MRDETDFEDGDEYLSGCTPEDLDIDEDFLDEDDDWETDDEDTDDEDELDEDFSSDSDTSGCEFDEDE